MRELNEYREAAGILPFSFIWDIIYAMYHDCRIQSCGVAMPVVVALITPDAVGECVEMGVMVELR